MGTFRHNIHQNQLASHFLHFFFPADYFEASWCFAAQECKKILRYDQKIFKYGQEIVRYEQELVRYDWENESQF